MCISVRNFSTSSFTSSLTTPSYTLKTVPNKNSVFRPSFKPRSPITSVHSKGSLTMSATWMYATIWRRIRNSMAPTLQNFYGKSTLTSMQSLARFTKVYGIRQMFGQQPSTKHNSSHITYHVTVVSDMLPILLLFARILLAMQAQKFTEKNKQAYWKENGVPHVTAVARKENKCSNIMPHIYNTWVYLQATDSRKKNCTLVRWNCSIPSPVWARAEAPLVSLSRFAAGMTHTDHPVI